MDEVFNVKRTAEILLVSPYTVRKWLRDGKLNGSRVSGQWRITNEQIKAFVKSESAGKER